MLELGKRQVLTVIKTVDFGVYLSEGAGAKEEVLLPKKEVPGAFSEEKQKYAGQFQGNSPAFVFRRQGSSGLL